jgi:hypothetical protein
VKVFNEKDGICVFEAEMVDDGEPVDSLWRYETRQEGYSGNGYFRWVGQEHVVYGNGCNKSDPISKECYVAPDEGILKYYVRIANPGNYWVWVRNYHAHKEGNDMWSGIDGATWIKEFDKEADIGEWTWSDRADEHWFGKANTHYLSSGVHTIYIAGRTGFPFDVFEYERSICIDKIAVVKWEIDTVSWKNNDYPCADYDGEAPLYPHDDDRVGAGGVNTFIYGQENVLVPRSIKTGWFDLIGRTMQAGGIDTRWIVPLGMYIQPGNSSVKSVIYERNQ